MAADEDATTDRSVSTSIEDDEDSLAPNQAGEDDATTDQMRLTAEPARPRVDPPPDGPLTDLRAYGEGESRNALAANDRELYQFWGGWLAALDRAIRIHDAEYERCRQHPANLLQLVCVECVESERTAAANDRAEAAEARVQALTAERTRYENAQCLTCETHLDVDLAERVQALKAENDALQQRLHARTACVPMCAMGSTTYTDRDGIERCDLCGYRVEPSPDDGGPSPYGSSSRRRTPIRRKGGHMAQFRKKPVVIEAIQWTGANVDEVLGFILAKGSARRVGQDGIAIDTLEGTMRADKNDWVIRGVAGEFYPCKPEIFATTYDAVTDADPGKKP